MARAAGLVKLKTVEVPDGVELTLTQHEADVLRNIVGHMGGGNDAVNSIWKALSEHTEFNPELLRGMEFVPF